MKLNNKGFAISGVLYSLLILFVTLFMGILTILGTSKFSFDKIKNDIINKMENAIYKDDRLNGADPEIKTGMIPVVISNDGTVKKADLTSEWYNYSQKKWANVVMVTESTRNSYEDASPGALISEADILAYLVWIPRYRYKLWYTEATDAYTGQDTSKVHSIDIIFETKNTAKTNDSNNGEYLTHPAFTFGNKELNGIWVGKFETGYKGATDASSAQVSTSDTSKLIIKPNSYSWRNMNVSNMYSTVKNMNTANNLFGLTTDSDTHMMKNIEWGAVTYLSHSSYGKNNEVYINNNSNYKTGCGSNTINEESGTTCHNQYGNSQVYSQSTTGNISGIFDMSGGAEEYVMGYVTEASTQYGNSGFTAATYPTDSKYINNYLVLDASNFNYSKRILGDATGEIGPFAYASDYYSSWYNDSAVFPSVNDPWFIRGGNFDDTSSAGLFSFSMSKGAADNSCSFRVVIS